MTTSTTVCDRCGCCVLEGKTVVNIETGPLRAAGLVAAEFCQDCAFLFRDFIRSGRADNFHLIRPAEAAAV